MKLCIFQQVEILSLSQKAGLMLLAVDLAKACGAAINAIFIDMATLLFFGSIISLGFVGLWIVIALYIGRTNQKLVRDNKIIS